MSAPNQDHPDRSELEAFGVGVLDPARSTVVEQHVAACDSCCEAVRRAPNDSLVNQLREAAASIPPAAPPAAAAADEETIDCPSAAVAAPVEPPADLARHPRYRLLQLLGTGGMGAVYQAEHGVMRRLVALKVINRGYTANRAAADRFQREIRAAAQLHHPNIVAAYDAEQAGDTHFLVMEYIDGVNLARLVAEKGPLPVAEACDYVRQAALGLQYAHERGMVHRDVKPHNLIRAADGMVKVLDFGLASVGEPGEGQLTGTNVVMGTPDYIAPEQAEDTHAADARSDIYALGCTLYHLLTGRPPFTHPSTLLKLVAHREEAPAPVRAVRPDMPEELAAVLSRMLAKAPVDRYQTAAEVAAALAPFAEPKVGPSRSDWPATRGASRPPWRRRLLVAGAAAALFAAVVAAAVVVRIQTEQGEVTIQTDDPNIEVVVTKGGKLVRIVDPQSKQTWQLDPAKFELSMTDQPDGLTIALDGKQPFVLKRKGEKLVTITRGRAEAPVTDIQVRQRVRLLGTPLIYQTAVSPDGGLFAADLDYGRGVTSLVWDGQTGQELHRFTGWLPGFTSDGKRFLVDDGGLQVYDVATWTRGLKVNHEGEWGYEMLPGGRHVVLWTDQHKIYLDDVEGGKVLQSWPFADDVNIAATEDGNVLFVKPAGEKSFQAWDLQKNKQVDAFAAIANYERIWWFLPGNKQAAVLDGDKNRLVNVVDGQRVAALPELPGSGLKASSQHHIGGRIALQGYEDGKLRLFDAQTGKQRASFSLPDGESAVPRATICLSPDARYACVASNHSVYLLRLPDPPADKPADAP